MGDKKTVDELKKFNWRKKNIFFEFEHWVSLKLRHDLDLCASLLNTVLGKEKLKDIDSAKKNFANMKSIPELHLYTHGD